MRSPSQSKSMGLVTKALQPAARARARRSGSWWAVTATMTVSLSSGLARMRSAAPKPSRMAAVGSGRRLFYYLPPLPTAICLLPAVLR